MLKDIRSIGKLLHAVSISGSTIGGIAVYAENNSTPASQPRSSTPVIFSTNPHQQRSPVKPKELLPFDGNTLRHIMKILCFINTFHKNINEQNQHIP